MINRIIFLICLFAIHNFLFAAESQFPVKVKGNELVLNDGTDRRFFLAGMVANNPRSGEQLSKFDIEYWEKLVTKSKEIGANSIRWNAFLFGRDFTWDENGLVNGMHGNSFSNLKKGLDLAHKNGIMVQVVLSTAHFLKYGWGGEAGEFNGTTNLDRINNNYKMFTTDEGIEAYINHIIQPMTDSLGIHPALLGFCVSNEAYGMTKSENFSDGWSDILVDEKDFAKFANIVSGELHRRLPGVILSISSVAEKNSIYTSETLLEAGGDTDGTLDVYQYQYYPKNHKDPNSPILNTIEGLAATAGLPNDKPAIAGEFWMHGITDRNGYLVIMSTTEAYDSLWTHGFSGGFTWSDFQYFEEWNDEIVSSIDSAFTTFNSNYLANLDPWEFWKPYQDEIDPLLNWKSHTQSISVQLDHQQLTLYNLPDNGKIYLYNLSGKIISELNIHPSHQIEVIKIPANQTSLYLQIKSSEGNYSLNLQRKNLP